MSLTGGSEYWSARASPEVEMAETIPPTMEILTAPQFQSPTLDLLSVERREEYLKFGVPFYHAAFRGDWVTARDICDLYPNIVRARITKEGETGLHIAAAGKKLSFVRMLVKLMTPADIALTSKGNNTALWFAAASGIVDMAKLMVEQDASLPLERGGRGMMPLHAAASFGHRDMVNYLLPLTDLQNNDENLMELFISLINTNLYDVALEMQKKYPTLATARDKNRETALHVLARKHLSFIVHQDKGLWRRLISSGCSIFVCINSAENTQALNLVSELWKKVVQLLDDEKISELIREPAQLLFVATASGNVEFIKILLKIYPDLMWEADVEKESMFHVAVENRQESIFRIIYEFGAIKDLIARREDSRKNNMLHLAAKLAPSNRLGIVSGAAFQLQRELMWFKVVEKIVQPSYPERKNLDGFTPKELFVAEHKELRKEGEAWMKSTAQSCMIVAALIATVMFATAFTLPTGTLDNQTQTYFRMRPFSIFVISDSISLLSSTASILMFLSILTSRYEEEDFLHSLPTKLILGLSTLFLSMLTMMMAFTASMFIIFPGGSHGAAMPISFLASILVTLYALLQYNLFADIFSSTYYSNLIFQPNEIAVRDIM